MLLAGVVCCFLISGIFKRALDKKEKELLKTSNVSYTEMNDLVELFGEEVKSSKRYKRHLKEWTIASVGLNVNCHNRDDVGYFRMFLGLAIIVLLVI